MSVLYLKGDDDATFDMDYYSSSHMAIVERTMKPSRIEIDHGTNGPYIAAGHLYFDTPEAFQAGLGEAGEAQADVPNFTTCEQVMQISNIVDR